MVGTEHGSLAWLLMCCLQLADNSIGQLVLVLWEALASLDLPLLRRQKMTPWAPSGCLHYVVLSRK